jgi:glycosyltransferase involved in cell wall biosynthesis
VSLAAAGVQDFPRAERLKLGEQSRAKSAQQPPFDLPGTLVLGRVVGFLTERARRGSSLRVESRGRAPWPRRHARQRSAILAHMDPRGTIGGAVVAEAARRPRAGSVELSVVIPVYNEREALSALLDEVQAACAETGRPWEVIFVDDGSTDGSTDVLEQLAHAHRAVRLVQLRRNFGKSSALRAGFDETQGAVVVTLDGDRQDDPAEIPALVAKLDEGYDVVSGWKQERRDPPVKRWGSRIFNMLSARLSGVPLHDVNCGIKAYRGSAIRALDLYGEQHRLIPVIGFQRGWRVAELPVHHRPREEGRSKFGPERYVRGLLDLMGVLLIGRYQYRPLHLFGGTGLILFCVGLIVCVYLTIEKIGGEAIGDRPLLMLGVLLIVAGIQLFTLGLVGEMITATRRDVRRDARAQVVERIVDGSDR